MFTLLRIVENLHYSLNNRVSSMTAIGTELFWLIMVMGNLFITFFIATKVEQIVRLKYDQIFQTVNQRNCRPKRVLIL